jgi:hypothetical protein
LPADSACSFTSASVEADTSTALVITTKAPQSARLQHRGRGQNSPTFAVVLSFGGFGLLGLVIVGNRKRVVSVVAFLGLLLLCGLATSCGGASTSNSNNAVIPGTPTGSYNVTVTASSGSLTHNTQLTLVVK